MKVFGFIDIWIRDSEDEIQFTVRTQSSSTEGPPIYLNMNQGAIENACMIYWNSVDEYFRAGVLTGDNPDIQSALSSFILAGITLEQAILPCEVSTLIWEAAVECDEIILNTNLHNVPWEAFFKGNINDGCFLGEKTLISRKCGSFSEDKILNGDSECELNKKPLFLMKDEIQGVTTKPEFLCFEEKFGVEHLNCSSAAQLASLSASRNLICAVGHNARSDGVLVGDGLKLCSATARAIPVRYGCVILLMTCDGSIFSESSNNVVKELVVGKGACVITSCSKVELGLIKELMRLFFSYTLSDDDSTLISDFWRDKEIQTSEWIQGRSIETVPNILKIFFPIFGNTKAVL